MRIAAFCLLLIGCGSSDDAATATTTDTGAPADTAVTADSATTDSATTDTATEMDASSSLKVKSITLKVDGTAVTVGTDVAREYNKNNVKWTIGKPAGKPTMGQYYVVLDIGAISKPPSDSTFSTADVQFKTLTIFHASATGETSYSSLGTTGFKDMATVDTAAGTLDYTASGTMKLLSGGSGGPASFAMELTLTGAPLR